MCINSLWWLLILLPLHLVFKVWVQQEEGIWKTSYQYILCCKVTIFFVTVLKLRYAKADSLMQSVELSCCDCHWECWGVMWLTSWYVPCHTPHRCTCQFTPYLFKYGHNSWLQPFNWWSLFFSLKLNLTYPTEEVNTKALTTKVFHLWQLYGIRFLTPLLALGDNVDVTGSMRCHY